MSFGAKGSHGIPIDRVREMAARGFTEPEMIDILRNEGYSAEQIDRALTLALRAGVTEPRYGERRIPKPEDSESRVPTYGEILERSQPPPSRKPPPPAERPREYYPQNYQSQDYSEMNKRINETNEQIRELAERFQGQQQIILKMDELKGQVNSTTKNLEKRVEKLEKAFKDTLPAVVQTVRTISDLVHKMKTDEAKKKEKK